MAGHAAVRYNPKLSGRLCRPLSLHVRPRIHTLLHSSALIHLRDASAANMKVLHFAAVLASILAGPSAATAQERTSAPSAGPVSPVSAELKTIYDQDQAERTPSPGKVIDWSELMLKDEARQKRVKELLGAGDLRSGADFYHAAMVLQHADEPEDHLLAHDLCVIAISKGEQRAKWLAAASLDRFLVGIARPQRYGTQFRSNHASRPPKLAPVDPSVPDQVRRELGVPTLEEAKATEANMAKEFENARHAGQANK